MSSCSQCTVRNRAICSALNVDEVNALGRLGHRIRLARGQTLVWEGDDSLVVANVISGVLKLSVSVVDGREQIVGLVFPSDFMGRPFGDQSPFGVTALTDAEVCAFPRSSFDRFAREHPHLEHKLLQRTLDELDRARGWMTLLGKKSAEARIATLLLDMSKRLADSDCTNPTMLLDQFELPLDRQQIGDVLGLTIETVSRQLTRLKGAGVIDLPDRRTVVIHDRDALNQVAEAA